VFEKRMLRRIFIPKRDEVTEGSRKLYNEKLHNLYSSLNVIRMIKSWKMTLGRACSTNGEKRIAYRILVGKPEGKRPLQRPRCRWVDNIKMDRRGTGWCGTHWTDLVHDGGQWTALVKSGNELSCSIKCWEILE
jgi:hypothetical protein